MKTNLLRGLALLTVATSFAQQGQTPAPLPPLPQPATAVATSALPKTNRANYSITVSWIEDRSVTNALRVLTGEGPFSLETIQFFKNIDQTKIPSPVSLSGTLEVLDADNQARLKFFLGRTVPFVSGTNSVGSATTGASCQQLRIGLQSTFTVTFGKPVVVQADPAGEVTILVKREDN